MSIFGDGYTYTLSAPLDMEAKGANFKSKSKCFRSMRAKLIAR